jgi:hypothetical protein
MCITLGGVKGRDMLGPDGIDALRGRLELLADLDARGFAVRVGHHCACPIVRRHGIPATTRATFYVCNTPAEGIRAAQRYFGSVGGQGLTWSALQVLPFLS